MKLFDPNPQSIRIPKELLDQLGLGLLVYAPEMGYPNGIKSKTIKERLPDGNYSIKCHVFEFVGSDENGATRSQLKVLGYLTQEAMSKVSKHKHFGCNSKLEVRSV